MANTAHLVKHCQRRQKIPESIPMWLTNRLVFTTKEYFQKKHYQQDKKKSGETKHSLKNSHTTYFKF